MAAGGGARWPTIAAVVYGVLAVPATFLALGAMVAGVMSAASAADSASALWIGGWTLALMALPIVLVVAAILVYRAGARGELDVAKRRLLLPAFPVGFAIIGMLTSFAF